VHSCYCEMSMLSAMDLEGERLIDGEQCEETPKHWRKRVGLLVAAVALVGLAGAVCATSLRRAPGAHVGLGALAGKDDAKVEIAPSDAACSTWKENCMHTGCCKVTGHKCFVKTPGVAMCNETCTPGLKGFDCGLVSAPTMPVVRAAGGTSLYCIAVYTQNTGCPKPSTEKELLTLQNKYGASIFGCEGKNVFSDAAVDLGKGIFTIQVEDTYNEFHQIKRETGSWVNWAIFFQVWMKVREVGTWHEHDFTIKVDPDAVFIPSRMRNVLSGQADTEHGVYYENCKNVQMGYFGNLEVMSNKATAVLTANLEDCHLVFAPCANDGCDWKWGPWGEDVFAQRCMDRHHVEKVQAWHVTTDGACKADRPEGEKDNKKWSAPDCSKVDTAAIHPFKKPKDYFKCLGEVMNKKYEI